MSKTIGIWIDLEIQLQGIDMITLEQMRCESFDYFKLNKEDRRTAIDLVVCASPSKEIEQLNVAIKEYGWMPMKYLGDNKWGCALNCGV